MLALSQCGRRGQKWKLHNKLAQKAELKRLMPGFCMQHIVVHRMRIGCTARWPRKRETVLGRTCNDAVDLFCQRRCGVRDHRQGWVARRPVGVVHLREGTLLLTKAALAVASVPHGAVYCPPDVLSLLLGQLGGWPAEKQLR